MAEASPSRVLLSTEHTYGALLSARSFEFPTALSSRRTLRRETERVTLLVWLAGWLAPQVAGARISPTGVSPTRSSVARSADGGGSGGRAVMTVVVMVVMVVVVVMPVAGGGNGGGGGGYLEHQVVPHTLHSYPLL